MNHPDVSTLRQAVEEHRADIVDWITRFASIPSENRPPGGAEFAAQDWLQQQCEDLGLEVDRFSPLSVPRIRNHPHWLCSRGYPPGRDNVVAAWHGRSADTGSAGSVPGPSLLFSGHTDVAPREPGEWKVCAPFSPVVRDGRLYGRGTADMKGGLAAAYWAIRILKELSVEPAGTIIFEAVVDEEFAGGNGTLASRLRGYNADLAVYMEPSGMELCTAGLGAFLGDMTITGQAGMPYTGHDFSNPVFGMGRAIQLFDEWLKRWRARSSHPLFDPETKPLNVVLWDLSSNAEGAPAQMGTPDIAKVSWIVWCHPGTEEADFYREFRQFWQRHFDKDETLRGFRYDITPTYHHILPWETDPADDMVLKLATAYNEYAGTEPTVTGAPFSSDLAVYGLYGGMPSVILGPRGDNLHGPDEWVFIDDLCTLTGIFARLMLNHCSSVPGNPAS
ncbi:MAG: M20 family metallopeptidase [Spirochaetaceae bacterium]